MRKFYIFPFYFYEMVHIISFVVIEVGNGQVIELCIQWGIIKHFISFLYFCFLFPQFYNFQFLKNVYFFLISKNIYFCTINYYEIMVTNVCRLKSCFVFSSVSVSKKTLKQNKCFFEAFKATKSLQKVQPDILFQLSLISISKSHSNDPLF